VSGAIPPDRRNGHSGMSQQDGHGSDESGLIAQRREKLRELREAGRAYPNDFRRDALAGELHEAYDELDEAELEARAVRVRVAGRMMAKRVMGKASFTHLQDMSGRIQLFLQRDALPDGVYRAFRSWDIGDIVGAEGLLFKTRTGELSVRAQRLELLSKSLRPLPEKFHGLQDQETRYRQRYLDLIVNPEVRETFRLRSRIIEYVRAFLSSREFLEVETPMMQPIPGGAAARPFITHHNALDTDLYLRIAPELYLKRLVVGGFERVFEINRNFRNEGVSTRHNPEFTMLEFYQAYAGYEDLMDLTEELLRGMARHLLGSTAISYQGHRCDFSRAFPRITVREAVLSRNPQLDPARIDDRRHLAEHCAGLGLEVHPSWGPGKLQSEIYEKTVEPGLVDPTFVTEFPTEVSPLARQSDRDPAVTERFELIVAGREIANGFSELNDPDEQARRFLDQVAQKDAGDEEAMFYDDDYVRALEYGMPPTAGEGIGIDRLVMLLGDAPSIRDVLLFPLMRPQGTRE